MIKNPLVKGLLINAIVTASGIFTGMPAVDPDHFNFSSLHGIERMLGAIAWLVFLSECRYIQDWFKNFTDGGNSPVGPAK